MKNLCSGKKFSGTKSLDANGKLLAVLIQGISMVPLPLGGVKIHMNLKNLFANE